MPPPPPPPPPPPAVGGFRSSRRVAVPAPPEPPGVADATGRGGMKLLVLEAGRGRGAPGVIGRGRGRADPPDGADDGCGGEEYVVDTIGGAARCGSGAGGGATVVSA